MIKKPLIACSACLQFFIPCTYKVKHCPDCRKELKGASPTSSFDLMSGSITKHHLLDDRVW